MVSDAELAEKVHELLRCADLKKTTNNTVIKKLECDYGVDLSSKTTFVRHQVSLFLQTQYEVELHELQLPDHVGSHVADYANDDVFFSDDDDDVNEDDIDDNGSLMQMGFPVQPNNNGDYLAVNTSHANGTNHALKERPGGQQKEKIKRTCLSGKYCTLSPQLQKFIGVPHMTRTQVVKHLWAYVKNKNLQDPWDGKRILCDDTLRELLGADSISVLEINKALTQHIRPSVKRMSKDKSKKPKREEEPCGDGAAEKRQKKTLSGFLAPLPISETLINFLGTGETALTRADVIKRVWKYIKAKNLQDPSDKKMVLCDDKLKELVNVDYFHGFMVSKLLSAHLNVRR